MNTDYEEQSDIALNLTLSELHALHKTVGIAIDNVTLKIGRQGPDSRHGREASADLRLLVGIQQEILSAIQEVNQ
jgi:hypothetical protein